MASNGQGNGPSLAKRQKLDGPLIGTHNGHFHADEALAVFLLRLLPEYHESALVRTRDPEVLKTCHTVVDVGGEYDVAKKRFDHHHRDFSAVFPGRSTKLSSAGLVYMHLGKAIIAQQTTLKEDEDGTEVLYQKIYRDFVEAFDANDNGISQFPEDQLRSQDIKSRFNNSGFTIASVVNRYNHHGPEAPSKAERQRVEDERFQHASAFTGQQFLMELNDTYKSWLPARSIVRQAFSDRLKTHESGRILVLPHRDGGLPWADHLYGAEEEEQSGPAILYVLFPETGEEDSKWRIRAVGVSNSSFENRKGLPEAWRGVRDEALSEKSGVPGCVFVHASGFIGGNATFDGALQMAVKAVAE